jgi:predicted acylesterase/phospholipase RssA
MDYYLEYIKNTFKEDKFYIKININKIKTIPFILNENIELNSQTLYNSINLYNLQNNELSSILTENNLKKIRQYLLNSSYILNENIIFYEFDLCNNFLLSKNSNKNDIKYILNKIKINKINKLDKIKDYSLIPNPYKIEKVIFSGGGSKGMIYLGVILGLYSSGSIFYLNYFSGTSIGALTATLLAFITPTFDKYNNIKNKSINEIITDKLLIDKYKKCINFIIERFISRPIDTFYTTPNLTISSIYKTVKKILYQNYLYDFENSGFGVWYALMCKYICKTMENDLDELIVIKNNLNQIINIDNITFEEDFEKWTIEKFITFEEYNKITGKSLVLTGTKWNPIETVYYSKEDYPNTQIIKACNASSCLPGVFKPVIINDTHNLDGGLFDNYPLTYVDKKNNNTVIEYDNRTIGFLIDDQNSIIEPYEIIRELWLLYNGFINNISMVYLIESENYNEINEIFFEIRLILFNLLYCPITELNEIINILENLENLKTIENIQNLIENIKNLNIDNENNIKIGKKTDLDDIFNIILKHGYYYNIIINIIDNISTQLDNNILIKIKYLLSFYEIKGIFFLDKNIENMSVNFIDLIMELKTFILKLEYLSDNETIKLNKINKTSNKNYIQNVIDISKTTLQKILTRITKKNKNINDNKKESYYKRIISKLYESNISDIIYKYICVANDRICTDMMNNMRTVKLNTFETNTLHFKIDNELISRLIYEGYSKTIKHYVSMLYLMEITNLDKSNDMYLESYEVKYKKLLDIN